MKFLRLTVVLVLIYSCSTKKDVVLLQDYNKYTSEKFNYKEIIIKPGDILKIDVSSVNPEAVIEFNKPIINSSYNSIELLKMQGYNVSNDGNIQFPVLGSVNATGLSSEAMSKKSTIYFSRKDFLLIIKLS